jgi:hypothetical protein
VLLGKFHSNVVGHVAAITGSVLLQQGKAHNLLQNEMLGNEFQACMAQNMCAGQTQKLVVLRIILLLTSECVCRSDTGTKGTKVNYLWDLNN